jgi:MinD-like ATPase involved in chromosome partitioning or flagellar assembly
MRAAAGQGRIVTFYSYKGGIGRSTAVAGLAWYLATAGKRVLAIDWDLDSPGLHHCFRPYLVDPALTASPGIIDFIVDFADATSRLNGLGKAAPGSNAYGEMDNLLRVAESLSWDGFPSGATLDFVAAGRQDSGYAAKLNFFNWRHFFENLEGYGFLAAMARRLRSAYDYVLIDGRTGVSDGTCTARLPDDLVVCFAIDAHSLDGALASARAAHVMRRGSGSDRPLRLWPLAMRVDAAGEPRWRKLAERAHDEFQPLMAHLPAEERSAYWGDAFVPYDPALIDRELAETTGAGPESEPILRALRFLSKCLETPPIAAPNATHAIPARPSTAAASRSGQAYIFLSYAHSENEKNSPGGEYISDFREVLTATIRTVTGKDVPICWDQDIDWGERWRAWIEGTLERSAFVIAILTPSYFTGPVCREELRQALERERKLGGQELVLPVYLVDDARMTPPEESSGDQEVDELAMEMSRRQYIDWRKRYPLSPKKPTMRKAVIALATRLQSRLQPKAKV